MYKIKFMNFVTAINGAKVFVLGAAYLRGQLEAFWYAQESTIDSNVPVLSSKRTHLP